MEKENFIFFLRILQTKSIGKEDKATLSFEEIMLSELKNDLSFLWKKYYSY